MQVPLLLLSSSPVLSCEDVGAWITGLLTCDGALSSHVQAHCVCQLPAIPSPEATAQLLNGLEWLAQQAPAQPLLQVCLGSSSDCAAQSFPATPATSRELSLPFSRRSRRESWCGRSCQIAALAQCHPLATWWKPSMLRWGQQRRASRQQPRHQRLCGAGHLQSA